MLRWPLPKDPDDIVDLQFDWTNRLEAGETIATSAFTIDEGTITIDEVGGAKPPSIDGSFTTFWVRGGVDGETCVITNRVVTSEDRQYDWTGRLRIKSTS
jgi:hypothetical protein